MFHLYDNLTPVSKKRLKYIFSSIIVIFVCLLASKFVYAAEVGATEKNATGGDLFGSAIGFLVNNILKLVSYIVTSVVSLLITLLVQIIVVLGKTHATGSPAVAVAWTIVRDICNMFFIIIFMVIAVGTLLNQESYNAKKLLPKFLAMVVVINFSKIIFELAVSVSDSLMNMFINSFAYTGSGWFIKMFNVTDLTASNGNDVKSAVSEQLGITFSILAGMVASIVTLIILFAVVGALVMRLINLWIYITISPLYFLGQAWPDKIGKYTNKIMSKFTQELIGGPVLLFFIWMALYTASTNAGLADMNAVSNSQQGVAQKDQMCTGFSKFFCNQTFQSYLIMVGMLLGGLMAAKEVGGSFGDAAGKANSRLNKMKDSAMNTLKHKSGVAAVQGAWGGYWNDRKKTMESKTADRTQMLRGAISVPQKAISSKIQASQNKFGSWYNESFKDSRIPVIGQIAWNNKEAERLKKEHEGLGDQQNSLSDIQKQLARKDSPVTIDPKLMVTKQGQAKAGTYEFDHDDKKWYNQEEIGSDAYNVAKRKSFKSGDSEFSYNDSLGIWEEKRNGSLVGHRDQNYMKKFGSVRTFDTDTLTGVMGVELGDREKKIGENRSEMNKLTEQRDRWNSSENLAKYAKWAAGGLGLAASGGVGGFAGAALAGGGAAAATGTGLGFKNEVKNFGDSNAKAGQNFVRDKVMDNKSKMKDDDNATVIATIDDSTKDKFARMAAMLESMERGLVSDTQAKEYRNKMMTMAGGVGKPKPDGAEPYFGNRKLGNYFDSIRDRQNVGSKFINGMESLKDDPKRLEDLKRVIRDGFQDGTYNMSKFSSNAIKESIGEIMKGLSTKEFINQYGKADEAKKSAIIAALKDVAKNPNNEGRGKAQERLAHLTNIDTAYRDDTQGKQVFVRGLSFEQINEIFKKGSDEAIDALINAVNGSYDNLSRSVAKRLAKGGKGTADLIKQFELPELDKKGEEYARLTRRRSVSRATVEENSEESEEEDED